jgi:hypothetical protein
VNQTATELERLRRNFVHCPDPGPAEDLPEAEKIWDVVRGEVGPEETAALADVALAQPEVAQEWRLARELSQGRTELRPVSTWRRRLTPVLAAAAVFLVALVPLLWRQAASNGPVYRGGDVRELRSEVVEVGDLSRDDCVLRWTDMGDDVVYSVTVTTVDLETLVQTDGLRQPELRVPGHTLAAIGDGGRILWRVEAVSVDGRTLSSKTFVQSVH